MGDIFVELLFCRHFYKIGTLKLSSLNYASFAWVS